MIPVVVVIFRELRHGQVSPVGGQQSGDPCQIGNAHHGGHSQHIAHRGPPGHIGELLCVVLLPGQWLPLHCVAVIAVNVAADIHQRDGRSVAAGEHHARAGEGLGQAQLFPSTDGHHPDAEQPLAHSGPPEVQQQGLRQHQHRPGQDQLHDARPRPAVHRLAEHAEAHQAHRQPRQGQIQTAGEVPPPGVGLGHVRRRGVPGGRQLPQIDLGVQGGVVGHLPLDGAAHVPGGEQLAALPLQQGGAALHGLSQGQGAVLQGPDLLKGELQLPQQLDLQKVLAVLLRVAAVAVLLPRRDQQALLLVVADVGPGHPRALFQFFDGHTATSCPYCKVSRGFTVKGVSENF